jgi:hypothetical protein
LDLAAGQLVTSERGVCEGFQGLLAFNYANRVSHITFWQSLACARSPNQHVQVKQCAAVHASSWLGKPSRLLASSISGAWFAMQVGVAPAGAPDLQLMLKLCWNSSKRCHWHCSDCTTCRMVQILLACCWRLYKRAWQLVRVGCKAQVCCCTACCWSCRAQLAVSAENTTPQCRVSRADPWTEIWLAQLQRYTQHSTLAKLDRVAEDRTEPC